MMVALYRNHIFLVLYCGFLWGRGYTVYKYTLFLGYFVYGDVKTRPEDIRAKMNP
jgi:hypothetical protein